MDEFHPPIQADGPVDTVTVTVSFLEFGDDVEVPIEADETFEVVEVLHPDVGFYRFLYETVGQEWIWWRRRLMDDASLQQLLDQDTTRVYVLYREGKPFGFFELDMSKIEAIDIAYFGLMPFAIGRGFGKSALNAAIKVASRFSRRLTLNTCTADHPRALENYLRAGFRLRGTSEETWEIPRALGFDLTSLIP